MPCLIKQSWVSFGFPLLHIRIVSQLSEGAFRRVVGFPVEQRVPKSKSRLEMLAEIVGEIRRQVRRRVGLYGPVDEKQFVG